jgi:hypothetical protein
MFRHLKNSGRVVVFSNEPMTSGSVDSNMGEVVNQQVGRKRKGIFRHLSIDSWSEAAGTG